MRRPLPPSARGEPGRPARWAAWTTSTGRWSARSARCSTAAPASICPSDAARAVEPQAWRALMPRARAAAGRLAAGGAVEVTQRGEVVDVATARGPVRVRRRR
jgi:Protein of unknown function (DUF3253)